jgi:predicted Zn-ribbon and HTH transcriptional regulator
VSGSPDTALTVRQQIVQVLTGARCSARDLAHRLAIPERQVEDHLVHIVKSVAGSRQGRFLIELASCQDCGFVFRGRTRLTRPSRCPKCRSEAILEPRFGIDP